MNIDLSRIKPELKEIIIKSLEELDFYLEALKNSLNEEMKNILKKNENKGLIKDDVNFNILSKKGKLSDEEKIEKKKLQRKIIRHNNIEEMFNINSKMCEIINGVDLEEVKGCIMTSYLQFLSNVYRNENGDTKNADHVTPLAIEFGKKVAMIYFRNLRSELNRDVKNENIKSTDFFSLVKEEVEDDKLNKKYNRLYFELGGKILDIFKQVDLFTLDIQYRGEDYPVDLLKIPDSIKSLINKDIQLFCAPSNLPMIVPPKPYGKENKWGGYLCNGFRFKLGIIIEKLFYDNQSKITDINIVYKIANSIASVPYKINDKLLQFLIDKGDEMGLLVDKKEIEVLEKEYEDKQKDIHALEIEIKNKDDKNEKLKKNKVLSSRKIKRNFI